MQDCVSNSQQAEKTLKKRKRNKCKRSTHSLCGRVGLLSAHLHSNWCVFPRSAERLWVRRFSSAQTKKHLSPHARPKAHQPLHLSISPSLLYQGVLCLPEPLSLSQTSSPSLSKGSSLSLSPAAASLCLRLNRAYWEPPLIFLCKRGLVIVGEFWDKPRKSLYCLPCLPFPFESLGPFDQLLKTHLRRKDIQVCSPEFSNRFVFLG